MDSALEPWEFELIVSGNFTVSMPDGSNVRKTVIDCIHKVQKKILETDEGDTKSILNVVQVHLLIVIDLLIPLTI